MYFLSFEIVPQFKIALMMYSLTAQLKINFGFDFDLVERDFLDPKHLKIMKHFNQTMNFNLVFIVEIMKMMAVSQKDFEE